MSDPDADPVEVFGVLAAEFTNWARSLGVYHDSLVNEGFTREEALALCIDFQRNQFHNEGGSE